MKFSQRQIIIVVAVIAVVGIVGYLVATNLRSSTRPPENEKVELFLSGFYRRLGFGSRVDSQARRAGGD